MTRNTLFRIFASLFLILAIGLEANHSLVQRTPWNGFELMANAFSIPLMTSWGLALVGAWSPKATFKPLMVIGIFFLFMHGAVISLGGNTTYGAIYMAAGLLSATCAAASHYGESARIRQSSRPDLRMAS